MTNSVVHFPSLRNTMIDLWHFIKGIVIIDIGEKHYLFKFFHVVDMNIVLDCLSWFYNNHLLLLNKLQMKEDLLTAPLNYVVFWIQIYDMPLDIMSEFMANHFGAVLGEFIE